MPIAWNIPLGLAPIEELKVERLHAVASRICDRSDEDHHAGTKSFSITPPFERDDQWAFELRLLDDRRAAQVGENLAKIDREGFQVGPLRVTPSRDEGITVADSWDWNHVDSTREDPAVFRFEFLTPTAFRKGELVAPNPSPQLIWGHLERVCHAFAPWGDTVRVDEIRHSLEVNHLNIHTNDFIIRRGRVNRSYTGFVGMVTIRVGSRELLVRRQYALMARAVRFSGIGANTTFGMGVVVCEDESVP